MSIYSCYLDLLKNKRGNTDPVCHLGMGCHAGSFIERRWVTRLGYLTRLVVPVLDTHDEVEVEIDDVLGIYTYDSLLYRGRRITRPLADITVYRTHPDAWLDDLCILLDIEPSRKSRTRHVIDNQLWHLGDVRIPRTHNFAPIYVSASDDNDQWREALCAPLRPPQGIILCNGEASRDAPNNHQVHPMDLLIHEGSSVPVCDHELLTRLLTSNPSDAGKGEEFFNARTGELMLKHMTASHTFSGKQKDVIAMFWNCRNQSSLKWSDVKIKTNCSKDPDSTFGKTVWREWIENVGRGLYRLRTTPAGK